MVGAKKKRKNPTGSLPQYKIGGIYHSTLHRDSERNGHFVVISKVISPTEVKVHLCTSSSAFATRGIETYDLIGEGVTYILRMPEIASPSQIGQSKHISIPKEIAEQLGIRLP